jgi:putative ATP-dependent endonuclease of OLD family
MRPITLEPGGLFNTLLQSQEIQPKHFEEALDRAVDALAPMTQEDDFAGLLAAYQQELERFLPLSSETDPRLCLELTDRTRNQVKQVAQLHVGGASILPIQKLGAGGRSLALLAMLTLIMRRRGRGILALEEPETFLFPHAQRRVIDEAVSLASQTFITTHSPYVLERLPVEGVGRLDTVNEVLKWHSISTDNVKQINLYSKRLRQVHCEALMGRGVLVVEGDSDRWWLTGVGGHLNGQEWNGRRQEALDLQGISVVSADTNGDILKLCNFFDDAGLRTIGLFDRTGDATLVSVACATPYPCLFLKATGIERVLASELHIDLLRKILAEAPHSRVPLHSAADVAALNEDEVRASAEDFLIHNKGSGPLHYWILGELAPPLLPATLCNVLDVASLYIAGDASLGSCSVLS